LRMLSAIDSDHLSIYLKKRPKIINLVIGMIGSPE
jgi:hypothetical protein